MLCNSCFPLPLHQLWPLLGNRQAVKLVFFAFCISNFEFVFCTNSSCKEHSILYFEFLQFLFSSTFARTLVLTGEFPSSKAFAFWILYFAFCILYFAFWILNFASFLHLCTSSGPYWGSAKQWNFAFLEPHPSSSGTNSLRSPKITIFLVLP